MRVHPYISLYTDKQSRLPTESKLLGEGRKEGCHPMEHGFGESAQYLFVLMSSPFDVGGSGTVERCAWWPNEEVKEKEEEDE